uniref:tRNA-dihydrouridine synthase A n=1 Tax=Rhizophora mucronata TaxID=61149 RepID=A0A2P2LEQ2_RHIMU
MVAKHYFPPLFRWDISIHVLYVLSLNQWIPSNLSHFFIFSVAPMMDWTDNHYRTLARLISKHAWLYTEMVAAETIVYQEGNLVLKLKVPTFGSAFL